MYLVDLCYDLLDRFSNRNNALYKYTYKMLKVFLNIFFPIMYKYKKPCIGEKTDTELVVSFTSFPARINTVWETAFTLLNQTKRASHVILWLAKEQFEGKKPLPKSLKALEKYGLEIKYCDDLKPHKKYYYSMTEYPNAIVVTADDDVFYPSNWLEKLIEKHYDYPTCVVCYWAHRITHKDGKILRYEEWDSCVSDGDKQPSKYLLPVGYAGVLYPPNSLDARAFNKDAIKSLCLTTDDLWLKAMSYLNGVEAIQVMGNPVKMFAIIRAQDNALFDVNVGENKNDIAIDKILCAYDELRCYHFE